MDWLRKLSLLALILLLPAAITAQTVKFTTANLQHGEGTDGVFSGPRQVTTLTATSPDIIFVQERTTGSTAWDSSLASAGYAEAVFRENAPLPSQGDGPAIRSEEDTPEIQSHSFISYAVFCL